MLQEFEELFDGALGEWNTSPTTPKLKYGASPVHGRAYPVSMVRKNVFRKEVNHLEQLGVLKQEPNSKWASPTFILSKKNGTVRFLTDFREVKNRLIQTHWPFSQIITVLQELEVFMWATSLYLNMGYYHIRLDRDSQKIYTILLPWGKYSYQRLPMRILGSEECFN